MGIMQRRKGRSFEQKVATLYRAHWPDITVRRSLQAHRPYEPDVVVEGGVGCWGPNLWTECNDAAMPNPVKKLEQAERDILKAVNVGKVGPRHYLPIVVWHKLGTRDIQLTTRLWVLHYIQGVSEPNPTEVGLVAVTMLFSDFLKRFV